MPGPVSDSFDPEFGTAATDIQNALNSLYSRVTKTLDRKPPVDIRELVYQSEERNGQILDALSEWEWRIIRFALERAAESI